MSFDQKTTALPIASEEHSSLDFYFLQLERDPKQCV